MAKKRAVVFIEAALAVIFWGASFVATKIVLREIQPVTVVWLRFAMGIAILGAAVALRKELALPERREWGYFALLGFLGITLHQWLQSTGLVTSQATTSAWIVASIPVFIAMLGWLFLRERLGWIAIFGIALAAGGVLLVISRGNFIPLLSGHLSSTGDLLVLLSAPNWAVFSVLSRSGLKRHPAARMMFFVMTLGWIFSSVLFIAGRGYTEIGRLSPTGWLALGFLGIFCSGLAYIFWYDALQALPASQVGVFLYLEPLVTALVAAALLAEPLLISTFAGGTIILVGVWLVNRPRAVVSKNDLSDLSREQQPGRTRSG